MGPNYIFIIFHSWSSNRFSMRTCEVREKSRWASSGGREIVTNTQFPHDGWYMEGIFGISGIFYPFPFFFFSFLPGINNYLLTFIRSQICVYLKHNKILTVKMAWKVFISKTQGKDLSNGRATFRSLGRRKLITLVFFIGLLSLLVMSFNFQIINESP